MDTDINKLDYLRFINKFASQNKFDKNPFKGYITFIKEIDNIRDKYKKPLFKENKIEIIRSILSYIYIKPYILSNKYNYILNKLTN